MNAGMELMGMKECRECGDPYTSAEPDTGVCGGCTMSREFAALRAELDAARLVIERGGQLVSHEERATKAEARVAELERERDEARERVLVMSDAWKAAMDNVARLREALTQVRDAMLATGQGPDGDDDPRRPVAAAVWRALASAPSAAVVAKAVGT